MSSSFLSLYSDNWSLSDRKGSLINVETASTTDSSSPKDFRSNISAKQSCYINKTFMNQLSALVTCEPLEDDAAISIADRSLLTLDRVIDSMSEDNVTISEGIILHRYIWEANVYEQNQDCFPLENVPIKCNILKTLVKLLADYRESEYQLQLEAVTKVLQYLNKLFLASHIEAPISLQPGRDGVPKPQASSLRSVQRPVLYSGQSSMSIGTSSMRYPSSSAGSIKSSSSKPRILGKWFSNSRSSRSKESPSEKVSIKYSITETHRKNNNKTALKRITTSHKMQDMYSMPEYKGYITSLRDELKLLPRTDRNDIIFNFVDKSINAFVVKDSKLLLQHCIEVLFVSKI